MNISYYFEDDGKEHSLDCEIDYEPAGRGSFEPGGLQIEPDSPASMDVYSAKLNGIDILVLLDQDVIYAIEQKAWDQLAEQVQP